MNEKVSEMADDFAEKEYITDGYERARIGFGFYHGYKQAQRDIIERVKAWMEDRDFDSHYICFDNCGDVYINQTQIEEDLLEVMEYNN